jgi:regulator of protease activity HflC (stomatin/prohibitin superfamily)
MSFLRRLVGGSEKDAKAKDAPSTPSPAEVQEAELAYERELMRAEAERLASDLLQRQMRYADRSWTPPSQGGEERATLGGGETGSG